MAGGVDHRQVIIVDKCWTLLPLSVLSCLLISLIPKNGAVFYVALMDAFGVSHQTASWPLMLHSPMTHMAGLLVSILQHRLSIYQITVLGSLLSFASVIASAFAPNIAWMCVTLGVFEGLSTGLMGLSLSLYAVVYFDKYRATASAYKYTGMTLAPLVFSMALSALIREYGLSGALLVISAIMLNALPVFMLMHNPRPVAPFRTKRAAVACSNHDSNGADMKRSSTMAVAVPYYGGSSVVTKSNVSNSFPNLKKHGSLRKDCTLLSVRSIATDDRPCGHPCATTWPLPIHKGCLKKDTPTAWTVEDQRMIGNATPKTILPNATSDKTERHLEPSNRESVSEVQHSHLLHFVQNQCIADDGKSANHSGKGCADLLKNPVLYLLIVAFTISDYAANTVETTILDYTIDKGSAKKQAEPIIPCLAVAEMVGRLTLPYVWDRMGLRRGFLVALCFVVAAVGLVVTPYCTNFVEVAVTAAAIGFASGCVVAMKPVLLSDYLGVHRLPLCWGFAGVALLPVAFGGPLLIGKWTSWRWHSANNAVTFL
ncbi:monocarboxylate transporter 9-like [Haemaphysalis longicornis]